MAMNCYVVDAEYRYNDHRCSDASMPIIERHKSSYLAETIERAIEMFRAGVQGSRGYSDIVIQSVTQVASKVDVDHLEFVPTGQLEALRKTWIAAREQGVV